MTELEERIYKCAKEIMPGALKRIESKKTNFPFISIPFICEGVIDFLIYNTKAKKFTKIKYSYGVGKCNFVLGREEFAGYFNDREIREIDISDIT